MAFETEIKAWVDDWDRVERHLRNRFVFNREFVKRDRYYVAADRFSKAEDGVRPTTFRLRADGETRVVTFKAKEFRDAMEFNREHEFTIDSQEAFEEFVDHVGFEPDIEKVKRGLSFFEGDLHLELVSVDGLGSFLEVEFIHNDDDPVAHAAAISRMRAIIAEAGIPTDRIEPRPYNQLLRAREGAKQLWLG